MTAASSASQVILFTVMPRGVTLDGTSLPVSVMVSPRLSGAPTLGSFGDWLSWTQRLKQNGLKLTLTCGANTLTVPIDRKPLEPNLWKAIFNSDTRVDDHQFNDYSDRLLISYPVRETLALLKSIYQIGGILLALPTPVTQFGDKRDRGNLPVLERLLNGLQVNWTDEQGMEWRKLLQAEQRRGGVTVLGTVGWAPKAPHLGGDGLPDATQLPDPFGDPEEARKVRHATAAQFALYHHIPPAPSMVTQSKEEILDFHKAISSLQSYPALLRTLGLVFDLEVPTNFVIPTSENTPGTLSVTNVLPGWTWKIQPTPRQPLATAYYYWLISSHTIFVTAPQSPNGLERYGMLGLDPSTGGLVQVDVDGAMHKTIILAESVSKQARPLHPEVFDSTTTMPSLRSAGLALVADERSIEVLNSFQQSKAFNDALESDQPQPRPFFGEDLIRGFRLDVWDSLTGEWHSLHRRNGEYKIKDQVFLTKDEEGFSHLALVSSAPGADPETASDFYLSEAIARWNGWSLSVAFPGKHLTRSGDPARAVPVNPGDPDFDPENPPVTPFKMTTRFSVVNSSLPSLRFGRRYRVRARIVDAAGNSLSYNDPLIAEAFGDVGLPADMEGFAYLRYEPVAAPVVVLRDALGATSPGSSIDRLVIRTFNSSENLDRTAPNTAGSDRHIVPPPSSIELAERMGMFDDSSGKLRSDPETYHFIAAHDGKDFSKVTIPGLPEALPVESSEQTAVPYIPDALARGAALRDLPGTPSGTIAKPGDTANPIAYLPLKDVNPRPGSVTLIDFQGGQDWKREMPFRLVLAEGQQPPNWNADKRVLTIFLPKATSVVVPLSSYLQTDDLKLLGVWQWIREIIEAVTVQSAVAEDVYPGSNADIIAQIIQRVVEGGHWMLTPPRLLTLVHAVQQPLGKPSWVQLAIQHPASPPNPASLQSEDMGGPTAGVALDTITAWRTLNAPDAFLLGGLRIHGASTAKVDILAEWEDPVDDGIHSPSEIHLAAHADDLTLLDTAEAYIVSTDKARQLGYYKPSHDLICFARDSDILSASLGGTQISGNTAPRHHFDDTKHHRVNYTAVASSRFRDYFPEKSDPPLDFTRRSEPVAVDVPSSARPAAPRVLYVVPTFGWERQTSTNLKRSVRFGGGLRVYMERPWYSSGRDELLGVILYDNSNLPLDREPWKPFITQWGVDPIWQTQDLEATPGRQHFPRQAAAESGLSLDESTPPTPDGNKGRVDVVGHAVNFDKARNLWYSDIVIDMSSQSYTPFVRLALARYQPFAIDDAKLSRVVLADFVQLTPDRSALITADPYHPRTLSITVSGPAPRGPEPIYNAPIPLTVPNPKATEITVTIQQRSPTIGGDLGWEDVPADVVAIQADVDGTVPNQPDFGLWSGTATFQNPPPQNMFRILIREHEYISADYTIVHPDGEAMPPRSEPPGRLIYAETIAIDQALIGEPANRPGSTPPPTTKPTSPTPPPTTKPTSSSPPSASPHPTLTTKPTSAPLPTLTPPATETTQPTPIPTLPPTTVPPETKGPSSSGKNSGHCPQCGSHPCCCPEAIVAMAAMVSNTALTSITALTVLGEEEKEEEQ